MRGRPTVLVMSMPKQDGPKDVLHIGQDEVVRLAVAGDELLDELAGVAHDGEQGDAGQQAEEAATSVRRDGTLAG